MRSGNRRRVRTHLALLFLCTVLAGASCPKAPLYSEAAYKLATSLKVESLELLEKTTEDYSLHAAAVTDLKSRLQQAHEHALGRPDNERGALLWEVLIDPDQALLGGFLRRWEEEGAFSETFKDEAKRVVEDAFDDIIELESANPRAEDAEEEND